MALTAGLTCMSEKAWIPSESAHTHTHTGTDQVVGESRAEGVQFVRALGGSVEQVADGNGTARRHHIQHYGAQKHDRDDTEFVFQLYL